MALSKDLLRVCEVNRIMKDHLDFMCDVEIDEVSIEPAELPRRIFKDRLNPLDMRPSEFRVTFGMSKEFFKCLLDLITPQLTGAGLNDLSDPLGICSTWHLHHFFGVGATINLHKNESGVNALE